MLIFLMALSLVGIIMIQLYWINNAIILKEAQFDQSVNTAMKEIAGLIEKRENVVLLSDKLRQFERTIVRNEDENSNEPNIWSVEDPDGAVTHISYIADGQQLTLTDQSIDVNLQVGVDYDSLKQTIQAIKGYYEIDTLSNALFTKYVYTLKAHDSVSYVIISHPEARTPKARRLGDVFERMVTEAEDMVKPIEELYSADDLAEVIEQALWSNAIEQPFEFAVGSGEAEGDYVIKSGDFIEDQLDKTYGVSLFPDEIYNQKNYQLFLTFPDKDINLWKSVSLLLLISALLTLIIITTFGTTIYMIVRQKKISDVKSDFINNMTHEFKTPIATISLAIDSINNPKTLDNKDNILYYTGIIKEENKRMNAQVENVLQMSLLDRHEMEFNLKAHDLHELIRNAIRKISLQVEERRGKIEVNLEAAHHIGKVDEVHFTNAILNLLDNANKYSPDAPEILVATSSNEKEISIRVSDKGIGMSREVQKRIFEKFYRQTSGNVHNVKGFGLGLAYVQAILQVVKGRIKITSDQGKGSTFELIIPIIKENG
jgi:two-component system phosphate regulon sensor histidine kinase PhoR